jgi:hypothetical protein
MSIMLFQSFVSKYERRFLPAPSVMQWSGAGPGIYLTSLLHKKEKAKT